MEGNYLLERPERVLGKRSGRNGVEMVPYERTQAFREHLGWERGEGGIDNGNEGRHYHKGRSSWVGVVIRVVQTTKLEFVL